jgi:hypothetical protein
VTCCLEGTVEGSRRVAWCRSTGRSATLIGAGNGLASREDCDCWLPAWLPDLAGLSVVRKSENSIGGAAADGVALVRYGDGEPDVLAVPTTATQASWFARTSLAAAARGKALRHVGELGARLMAGGRSTEECARHAD